MRDVELGLDAGGRVQEPGLLLVADRVGLANRGRGDQLDPGLGSQQLERASQGGLAIAEIRAQPDVCARHQRPRQAVAAVCSTGRPIFGLRTRTRTASTGYRSRIASAAAAASASSRLNVCPSESSRTVAATSR